MILRAEGGEGRFMNRTQALCGGCVVLVLASPVQSQETAAPQVIVNASNSVSSLPRERIADLFLKKVSNWADDTPVLSVDQSLSSPLRGRFSQEILSRPISAVQKYWEERIFSGRGKPPPVKLSDDEVIEFVAANPGAIGYVSEGVRLPAGVKVLRIKN